MDSGEVIPGLNDEWTLAGATMMEWAAGFVAFMIAGEILVDNVSSSMPLLMAIWFATTVGLAALRKQFPDEQRGVANLAVLSLGVCPMNIPPPAALQPVWSGSPIKELSEDCRFAQLGLLEALAYNESQQEGEN